MTGLDYFTWFVLIIIAATLIVGFVVLAQLPGKMAAANNHPQAEAINMAGWFGLIFRYRHPGQPIFLSARSAIL